LTKALYRLTLTSNLTVLHILTYLRPLSQHYFSSIIAVDYDDYEAFYEIPLNLMRPGPTRQPKELFLYLIQSVNRIINPVHALDIVRASAAAIGQHILNRSKPLKPLFHKLSLKLKIKQRLAQDAYGIMAVLSGLGTVAEHCI